MAYIVQQPGQKLNAEEIMEWVAKQVGISLLLWIHSFVNQLLSWSVA